jgi:hypothetical protein
MGRIKDQMNSSDPRPSDVADLRQWSLMGDVVTLKCVGKYLDAIERGGLGGAARARGRHKGDAPAKTAPS